MIRVLISCDVILNIEFIFMFYVNYFGIYNFVDLTRQRHDRPVIRGKEPMLHYRQVFYDQNNRILYFYILYTQLRYVIYVVPYYI